MNAPNHPREFPAELDGKKIVVLGAGKSGRSAAALLAQHDARVVLADDFMTAIEADQFENIVAAHVRLILGNLQPELVADAAGVVVSPGIRLSHPLLAEARGRGIPVVGELELGARYARSPLIAVTGTNGKTTTVHWIQHLLSKSRAEAIVCGNVGTALCDVAGQTPDWFVVEVSSYQLETVQRFHPRVAAVLNLAADHLERHPSAEQYLSAKARITLNQEAGDALVLNADDAAVWSMAARTGATVWGFSLQQGQPRGAYVDGGRIMVRPSPGEPALGLLETGKLSLPGAHNLANALAAVAVAWACGVEPAHIARGLQDFAGVEHRLERVRECNGVLYINDSKATNLASLEVALCSFTRPVVLLAGGRGKGAPYEPLVPLVAARVRQLIVFGEDAARIEAAWGPHVPARRVADLEEAVQQAALLARPGEVVLLSPACASFDQYRNFEERGEHFKQLVRNL